MTNQRKRSKPKPPPALELPPPPEGMTAVTFGPWIGTDDDEREGWYAIVVVGPFSPIPFDDEEWADAVPWMFSVPGWGVGNWRQAYPKQGTSAERSLMLATLWHGRPSVAGEEREMTRADLKALMREQRRRD